MDMKECETILTDEWGMHGKRAKHHAPHLKKTIEKVLNQELKESTEDIMEPLDEYKEE